MRRNERGMREKREGGAGVGGHGVRALASAPCPSVVITVIKANSPSLREAGCTSFRNCKMMIVIKVLFSVFVSMLLDTGCYVGKCLWRFVCVDMSVSVCVYVCVTESEREGDRTNVFNIYDFFVSLFIFVFAVYVCVGLRYVLVLRYHYQTLYNHRQHLFIFLNYLYSFASKTHIYMLHISLFIFLNYLHSFASKTHTFICFIYLLYMIKE